MAALDPATARIVTELRGAFERAETVEDVQYVCEVAAEVGRFIGSRHWNVESSLRTSMARLEKLTGRKS